MHENYGRDLDLNLLRVFAVVAKHESVTEAASRLYLTQPAVSAALRRLATALGTPLFARRGRGVVLTSRGAQLKVAIEPLLGALVEAALAPAGFDPKTSERTLRIGFADAAEVWLLPRLLSVLAREAPHMRIISIPVQFRTIAAAFATGLDAAVTVADELPPAILRHPLFDGGFVALIDPRRHTFKRLTERVYFDCEHVIVSYNGDLRGLVEDMLGKTRRIRCSVASFANVGAIVEGSALVATVPQIVADQILAVRPKLATRALPFASAGGTTELLWPRTADDDAAGRFIREHVKRIAATVKP